MADRVKYVEKFNEQFSLRAKRASCTITIISYRTLRVLQKLIRSKNFRVIITYLIICLLLDEKVEWQIITGLFHTCIKIYRMWSLLVLSDTKYINLYCCIQNHEHTNSSAKTKLDLPFACVPQSIVKAGWGLQDLSDWVNEPVIQAPTLVCF